MFKLILEKKKLCYHKKIIYLILHIRILKRFKLEKKLFAINQLIFSLLKQYNQIKIHLKYYF